MIPKTLYIGIDGVDHSRFEKFFGTPSHWHYHKAYTGGIVGEETQVGTWSGPGWATALTGVWANKHLITGNSDSQRANPLYPCILRHMKDYNRELNITSTVTWLPIHDFFANQLSDIDVASFEKDDAGAVRHVKSHIESGADINFLQLSDPDYAGHSYGYGARYDESLVTAFAQIEELRNAVEERQRAHPEEQWLIVLTTDHGRAGNGHGHGGHSIAEKTVFIATNLVPNAELTDPVTIPGLNALYGHAAHTSIVPTILRHMGALQQIETWRLDSIPFIGDLGVRKPRLDKRNKTLTWHSDNTGNVGIYKNQTFKAYQRSDAQQWEDDAVAAPGNAFSILQNATQSPVGAPYIRSVLDWGSDKLMFFFDHGNYSCYDLTKDRMEPGYPRAITPSNWPGLAAYQSSIVASFKWDAENVMFFLNDGSYIKYNRPTGDMSGYPRPIRNSNWPGLEPYAKRIKTAVRWKRDKVFIFLNDNRYLRYDVKADRMDAGYPLQVSNNLWPGVAPHKDKIVAAVRNGETNSAFFFLDDMTYLKYDMDKDGVSDLYPVKLPRYWPGLYW